jgi:Ca2+-binding EF-hand superfamily protein
MTAGTFLLQRMRWHCHTRRVLVKPFFADAEYNRRSMRVVDHITKAQFCQVLSRLGLDATNAELELLGRKFDDQQDGFVNYVSFACAVDPEEQSSNRDENAASTRKLAAFKTNGNFKASKIAAVQPGRPPITSDFPSLRPSKRCSTLEGLMRRLQEKVIQFKIPVADFLFDYDRHKLGAISRPQFRRGLNFAFGNAYVRESIASEEMSLLEDAYAREMLDGALFVDWKQFCNDINAAITLTHLETKPTATPHPHKIERQAVVLSPAEEARVQQLLAAMRKRFQIRSVYVKAPFHDFAQSTNSPMMVDHVTRQQFVQGLSRLGIEPAAADLELLFKKFDDGDEGSVNYVAFTTAVDDTETFSDRSRPVVGSNLYGGFRKPKVHEELLKSL